MNKGMKIRVEKGDYVVRILHGFSHGLYTDVLSVGCDGVVCPALRITYEAGELIPFGAAKRAKEFAKYHNQTTKYAGKVG